MNQLQNSLIEHDIDLIIFDCDGVLVDSEVLSKRVLLDMLKKVGANVSGHYFDTHFLGYNFEHVTAKVLADFSVTLTNNFRQDYRKALNTVFASELETTKDVKWLLSQLNIKSCVATSGSPEKVKNSLKHTGLDEYFIGHVFTSSEVEKGKPAPDLFLHAANKMGVSYKNCLVIEDSNTGIKAALAANMSVLRYTGASHMSDITVQLIDDICTINHWSQLFDRVPSVSSLVNVEG